MIFIPYFKTDTNWYQNIFAKVGTDKKQKNNREVIKNKKWNNKMGCVLENSAFR